MIYDGPDQTKIPRAIFKQIIHRRGKTYYPPVFDDVPEVCIFGKDYYNNHPDRHYNYKFNSWGLRGEEYTQYLGQSVNLCIGDSYTLNTGGPIDHAWPSLLGQKFDIPTLNVSMGGLSFHYGQVIVDNYKKSFCVERVFVVYNLFDRDKITKDDLNIWRNYGIESKIKAFKEYCMIENAYWQFSPPWSFLPEELKLMYEYFPECHTYIKNVKFDLKNIDLNLLFTIHSLREKYLELSGPSWPAYEKFCQHYLLGHNVLHLFTAHIDHRLINEFLTNDFNPTIKKMLLTNRDGNHLSYTAHKELANYFYNKVCKHEKMS